MTEEQRYLFDLMGYLHLKGALSPQELKDAQDAANRYIHCPVDQLPHGFSIKGSRYGEVFDSQKPSKNKEENAQHNEYYKGFRFVHGFAFDKALERLAFHHSFWSIVREFTNDKPALVGGTLKVDNPMEKAIFLHSTREDFGWPTTRYEVRDGRIYCDDFIVFPYLSDVEPGDGGLLVVPGSHKSNFERPSHLFNGGIMENLEDVPEGVVNITPKAGDVVIISELLTHGTLHWRHTHRGRIFLTLRYWAQHKASPILFPEEIKARLSPETLELIQGMPYSHEKKIGKIQKVVLSETMASIS